MIIATSRRSVRLPVEQLELVTAPCLATAACVKLRTGRRARYQRLRDAITKTTTYTAAANAKEETHDACRA
jgi:hypothetical protein